MKSLTRSLAHYTYIHTIYIGRLYTFCGNWTRDAKIVILLDFTDLLIHRLTHGSGCHGAVLGLGRSHYEYIFSYGQIDNYGPVHVIL
jgi:hypothetical protein